MKRRRKSRTRRTKTKRRTRMRTRRRKRRRRTRKRRRRRRKKDINRIQCENHTMEKEHTFTAEQETKIVNMVCENNAITLRQMKPSASSVRQDRSLRTG